MRVPQKYAALVLLLTLICMLLPLFQVSIARADDPIVTFPDPNLDMVIRNTIDKPSGDIHQSDLAGLTSLDASADSSDQAIYDLTGLQYCTSLTWLNLADNQVSNFSPLSNLTSLTYLDIIFNLATDISPLSSLTSLTLLHASANQINDISPLANLTSLTWLYLPYNQIVDVTALSNLTSLTFVDIRGNQISDIKPLVDNAGLAEGDCVYLGENPLSPISSPTYIRQLEARGVTVVYTETNEAPTANQIIAPTDPVLVNSAVSASATFTDTNFLDSHTALWDWGDGTAASTGVVTEADGTGGSVSGTHTYTKAGLYTVTLTVTDNFGWSGQSMFQYVVVYDPRAGLVTGAGWIDSPAGAFTANASLSGKAAFGCVAGYHKGTAKPVGQTDFVLPVAQLNFHSSSYDWLVVAGAKATLKGSGTIKGRGDFGFILTAIDSHNRRGGGVDKFRTKIWDKTTGLVIYDNQMGAPDDADPTTAVAGGRIFIGN